MRLADSNFFFIGDPVGLVLETPELLVDPDKRCSAQATSNRVVKFRPLIPNCLVRPVELLAHDSGHLTI